LVRVWSTPVALVVTVAAASGIAGTALAKPAVTVRPGLYTPNDAAIDLVVADNGRAIERGAIVPCTSGPSPAAGLPANTELFLQIPRRVRISPRGTFSYSGRAIAGPVGGTKASDVPTRIVLKGRFLFAKLETVGLIGRFSSLVCSTSRPISF
jgi:hypothetical protein